MSLKAICFFLAAATAQAQTVRISGTVVDEGQLPIRGATVRLTGDTSTTTMGDGRFTFANVIPGRHVLTVSSIGFEFRSLDFTITRDTNLSIVMMRRTVTLDTVVVRPRSLRIKATAVDSASGDFLLQAQATLYPGSLSLSAVSGVFVFDSVSPGPVTIVFEALEHLPTRIELNVNRDTTFRVAMGVDSVSGDFLLQAQATLYPGSLSLSAVSGVFVFDSVSAGPVTIVFEALEHLPTRIQLNLNRDTTVRVAMGVDSVALRMTALQVKRLELRTNSISMPTTSLNRHAIEREAAGTLHELLTRRAFEDPQAARQAFTAPPEAGCYFVDDVKVSRGVFDAMLPELVERVEIFRAAGPPAPRLSGRQRGERNFGTVQMFRVYTKRYVASLARKENLSRIMFSGSGLKPTCS